MSQPFHAGGAASDISNFRLHDGLGYMRATILGRIGGLDYTHFGSIIAIVGVVPTAWRFIDHIWRETVTWVKRFFIASVTIPAGDPLNKSVSTWILENVIEPRSPRFHTARTELGRADLEAGASLKKAQRPIQYLPHWESAWFWYRNERMVFGASRSLDNFRSALSDPTYDGLGGEELTVSCLGWSSRPLERFLNMCREFADKKAQFYVIIYSRDRYGLSWKPKYRKPLRRLETVHFDNEAKRALLADIRNYLDPRTKALYQSRSMPYRRGYLFYGPPGTGKSSLSTAIAGEFGLDLYEVKVPSIANDGDLEQMFAEIPPRCIVLLEDVDCIWSAGREQRPERPISDGSSDYSSISNVTLSGLLNVLDGVGSQEGRVVILTTNKPEQLDGALVRPGRVDFQVYLGYISKESAEQMFMRMFAPDLLSWAKKSTTSDAEVDGLDSYVSLEQLKMLSRQFAAEIPESTFTPSQLQGFFQLHLNDVIQAVTNISEWVKVECQRSTKVDRDYLCIDGQ